MKWNYGFILIALAVYNYLGCAPIEFSRDPNYNKCQNSGIECQTENGLDKFSYPFQAGSGTVDILIVDDNSGSMSFEQKHMAERFSTLLSSIKSLDYHIAITTTDISNPKTNPPRPINQNGALQDGNLIPFPNGQKFITRDTPDKENAFLSIIKRPETETCETWLTSTAARSMRKSNSAYQEQYLANCPSGDERGIYAANLAISKNDSGFIREGAHLAVIFLSDEDNRSFGHLTLDGSQRDEYFLEDLDRPDIFVSGLRKKLGEQKTISTHAVVVRPGDTQCLRSQSGQLGTNKFGETIISGFEGKTYANLVKITNGTLGDICSKDYAKELGVIGASIQKQNTIQLPCADGTPKKVNIQPTGDTEPINYTVVGSTVTFEKDIPSNATYQVEVTCNSLQ